MSTRHMVDQHALLMLERSHQQSYITHMLRLSKYQKPSGQSSICHSAIQVYFVSW